MKVLIAGESWQTHQIHMKGFDSFVNSNYETGVQWLKEALESNQISVDFIPNHEAPLRFPTEIEVLKQYAVVILSDIGSNTLLIHPDTFYRSIRTPNRLSLLKQYVEDGGGLCMIGGYLTFQGIDGRGHWHGTKVEEVLPVTLQATDDRVEVPEGFSPVVTLPQHPVLKGIPQCWPWLLGYNQLTLKPQAELILEYNGDPILAVQQIGSGRTAAFASDCAPHWGSVAFINWEYYRQFWAQLITWLAHLSR